MRPTDFQTVYDISQSADSWIGQALIGSFFPLIGLMLLFNSRWLTKAVSPISLLVRRSFGGLLAVITLPMAIHATLGHRSASAEYQRLLQSGDADFIEGCLERFHPMRETGHESEILIVGGQIFNYTDSWPAASFNKSYASGRPIRSDSAVRIWYDRNAILRLQVKHGVCLPAPDPRNGPTNREYP